MVTHALAAALRGYLEDWQVCACAGGGGGEEGLGVERRGAVRPWLQHIRAGRAGG